MKYSREMLINDTPQFIEELKKQSNKIEKHQVFINPQTKKSIWNKLKNIFK